MSPGCLTSLSPMYLKDMPFLSQKRQIWRILVSIYRFIKNIAGKVEGQVASMVREVAKFGAAHGDMETMFPLLTPYLLHDLNVWRNGRSLHEIRNDGGGLRMTTLMLESLLFYSPADIVEIRMHRAESNAESNVLIAIWCAAFFPAGIVPFFHHVASVKPSHQQAVPATSSSQRAKCPMSLRRSHRRFPAQLECGSRCPNGKIS